MPKVSSPAPVAHEVPRGLEPQHHQGSLPCKPCLYQAHPFGPRWLTSNDVKPPYMRCNTFAVLYNTMSYFDTGNYEYECTMVYLCKRCGDAKPLEDFYNKWDDKAKEEIYYKTCKECRGKTKVTKERNKNMPATWVKEFVKENNTWEEGNNWAGNPRELKLTSYKRYKQLATAKGIGILTQNSLVLKWYLIIT